jgi:D-3-phosphoglycerate dehydrogenase
LILAPFSERQLARLGVRVDTTYESWLDTGVLQDPDELGRRLAAKSVDFLVVEADFVFSEVFESAPGLRWVGVCRNGLNQVDLASATAHGVAVSHARGRNTIAVAELTLGLMLSLARNIPQAHHLVSGGGWRDPALGYRSLRGREIAGSTVGIIGFGQIGREVATKCSALGANVVAYDPFVSSGDMREFGVRSLSLARLAKSSDFVTVHASDSAESRGMLDDGFFQAMRPGSYFINTAASGLVREHALIDALRSGHLGGAALDVFPGHPLPASSALLSVPNLLLTPHIGGATSETIERHSRIMVDEIARLLDGKRLRYCVNPQYRKRA